MLTQSRAMNFVYIWTNLSAEEKCKGYIIAVTLGSYISNLVNFGRIPFFSDKKNFINVIFIKWCWAWTLLLMVMFILLKLVSKSLTLRRAYLFILQLLFGSLYWYTMTTIIDGLRDNIGKCSVSDANSASLCKIERGTWKYFMDISGHIFMMSFCNLFITFHLDEYKKENIEPTILEKVVIIMMKSFIAMFEISMIATILYWHTPAEKILGVLASVLGYTILFKFC